MSGSNNGIGSSALFIYPYGVTADTSGIVYVADTGNNNIRAIYPNKTVITLAGGSTTGTTSGSVNGVGSGALFYHPSGVTVDPSGILYVADTGNNKIRAIYPITCPLGFYLPSGALSCVRCPPDTYTSTTGPFLNQSASSSMCYPCSLLGPNLYSSSSADICCPLGSWASIGSTTCNLCVSGFYSDTKGATSASSCIPCPEGTFSSTIGASSLSYCNPCPGGTFSSTRGATSLTSCSLCDEGFYCPTNSSIQLPCPNGTQSSPGSSFCIPPSNSPTPSVTPSITPSASSTPPPFSCLSRLDLPSCKSPTVSVVYPNVPPVPLPSPSLFHSWPFFTPTLRVSLPIPPSYGESVNLTCRGEKSGLFSTPTIYTPCSDPLNSDFSQCASLPSSPEGTAGPVNVTLRVSGSAPVFSSTYINSTFTCLLTSHPLATSTSSGVPLPQYPLFTSLTIPTVGAPLSPPVLRLRRRCSRERNVRHGTVVGGTTARPGPARPGQVGVLGPPYDQSFGFVLRGGVLPAPRPRPPLVLCVRSGPVRSVCLVVWRPAAATRPRQPNRTEPAPAARCRRGAPARGGAGPGPGGDHPDTRQRGDDEDGTDTDTDSRNHK